METINKLLSKDIKNNTKNLYLIDHAKMVTHFGMEIGNIIFNYIDEEDDNEYNKSSFLKRLGFALFLHDIGKITENFQTFMKNKGKDKFDADGIENYKNYDDIRHNVISWAYVISRISGMNKEKYRCITSSILYHHMTNCDDIDSTNVLSMLSNEELSIMDEFYNYFKQYMLNNYNISYDDNVFDIISDIDDMSSCSLITEKPYINIEIKNNFDDRTSKSYKNEAYLQLIRSILIYSDRIVSACKCDLEKIYNNDTNYIKEYFYQNLNSSYTDNVNMFEFGYDNNRLSKQIELLDKTNNYNHNVIKACAGFGKTLLGLMWFFREKKRLLWVVPRNIIAEGTYDSIIRELTKMKLNDKIKVGLYYGNEVKNKNCNINNIADFDILVTNIDSIVKRTTINNMGNLLVNLYTSNVIFDEYHEFKMDEPIFSCFIRIMKTRSNFTNSKSLLLSATASNFDCLWGSGTVNYILDNPIIFGDTKIKIFAHIFEKAEELIVKDEDTFIINYTVANAQNSFKVNETEKATLIHARFTPEDRSLITEKLLNEHGSSSKKNLKNRNLVIGTNIIGTGLDISCKKLYDFVVSPESTIQRACGRVSRFGEYNEIEYHMCTLKKCNKLITDEYNKSLHEKWVNVLLSYNNKVIDKNKLYELYNNFLNDNKDEINQYYIDQFNNSSKLLKNIGLRAGCNNSKKKRLSSSFGYRGLNNSVFTIARYNDGNWSTPITVDINLINSDEENDYSKDRKNAILNNTINDYTYPLKEILKYKYKITGYDVNNLIILSKDKRWPLPLFNFYYDNKLGLVENNLQ